ncbi:restriction endonuclease subunit S [Lacticaseibacillus paracasei subsp. tolerans]|uniref:restriction endonuclease subunit S n=1 Tax=Lacticaseibacillus paracasei TaxID=1597 RepID=UPI0018AD4CC1|nr:restriction endonuclease subunit S [Lacticaseibacillus paracasei]QPI87462.1 restriction endonuclease subunit S [Lacticaseibacillus paracasei subsp. tolerans]
MSKDVKNVPALRFRGYSDAWEKRKLGDQLTLLKDGTHGTHKNGDFAFLLSAKNIMQNSLFFDDTDRKISKADFDNIYANYQIQQDDVLLTIVGTIGRVALFPSTSIPIAFQRSVAILRAQPLLSQNFLALELQTQPIQSKLKARSNMSAQAGIYLGDLKKITVSVPQVQEQVKMASMLTDINNLIAATQHKIDAWEQAKKALLQRLFDQSWRFKGYSDPWEKRKLREVSDVRDGTHASPKYYSQGYPLVTSKNLTSAGLDFSNISLISELDYKNINKRSRVDKGDILFGMIGTIGTPVMVHESNFAIKNVALIKEREAVLNSFLVQLLKSPAFINYIRNENVGGTQKFLSLNTIRNFRFSFPTSKEQAMVSRFLEKIDSLIAATQSRFSSLELLKKALLQDLFI